MPFRLQVNVAPVVVVAPVKATEEPWQIVVEPAAVTVGVAGAVPIVTTTSSEAEQPPFVTVTLYVPAVGAGIVCVVAPGITVPLKLH